MYTLEVPVFINGIETTQTETVYNIIDFPYEDYLFTPTVRKRETSYLNISAAFDIESTTITKDNNKHEITPTGFMYHWQICIKESVIFGRTWEEFTEFLDTLKQRLNLGTNRILVIYVHNLAYEFQFIHNFLSITHMFAKDKRKPMYIATDGIEFRCSYFLSNMSLSKFCENSQLCTHYKLTDTYDYRKVRTPSTPLDTVEQGYCYNDVRGLCECVDSFLLHDTITSIPLTNTGFVRREARHAMNTPQLRELFKKLALDLEQYQMLADAFRGGNTHANRYKADKILENVYSYDKQSSYPGNMLTHYFPMGKFMPCKIESQSKLDSYCSQYCVVMKVSFFNIKANFDNVIPYIPISKCTTRSNITNDNGRVLAADYIEITLTEIDLDIIRRTYSFDGFTVDKAMYAKRGILPRELRQVIIEYYEKKTTLKNVKEKAYEYMKSKNRLNSLFGMMVSSIIHNNFDFTGTEWTVEKDDPEKAIAKYYNGKNNFLSYQWGVYVTAHARADLQEGIDIAGVDIVYCDTDSVKFVGDKNREFETLNYRLIEEAKEADIPALCEHEGKTYYMGIWEDEGKGKVAYDDFKTLGAKKYAYDDDTGFHVTVSGMNKKKGAKSVGSIDNFNIDTTYTEVGRTVSYYNEEKIHSITVNGETFTTASNIGIVDTTYTLGITHEYYQLLESPFSYFDESESFDNEYIIC